MIFEFYLSAIEIYGLYSGHKFWVPMSLESELLLDYGDIPQRVGLFLLKQSGSHLSAIEKACSDSLSMQEVRNGLAILIQRRVVKFLVFEKRVIYYLDRDMLLRRLYFAIYLTYVKLAFSEPYVLAELQTDDNLESYSEFFCTLLVHGRIKLTTSSKIVDDMLTAGFILPDNLIYNKNHNCDSDSPRTKQIRCSFKYFVVNFSFLDQQHLQSEICKYVSIRYNEAAAEVFKSVLRCDKITRQSILDNLRSTKILLSENDGLINSKENIDDYLAYLTFGQILIRGMDTDRSFFLNSDISYLKRYRIDSLLSNKESKRIFNLICYKSPISDNDVTLSSLLSISKVKVGLLDLQRHGLISQKCNGEYKQGSHMEHSWMVDLNYACSSIKHAIENKLAERLKLFNKLWDGNYFPEDKHDDGTVLASDLLMLSSDHLIFKL